MNELLSWMGAHTMEVSSIAILSTCLLAGSVLATPWLVARLPEDYLLHKQCIVAPRSPLSLILLVARTVFGGAMTVLGLIMLITPGPGLIMMLLGVSIAEFPGKRRLFLAIATRPAVFRSLNWMRERRSMAPFIHP